MALLRIVVWTGLCVAMGVWLGTGQVAGRTPLEHAQRLWRGNAPAIERDAKELVSDVKRKVASATTSGPREQHTADERAAIDDIIAKRSAKN